MSATTPNGAGTSAEGTGQVASVAHVAAARCSVLQKVACKKLQICFRFAGANVQFFCSLLTAGVGAPLCRSDGAVVSVDSGRCRPHFLSKMCRSGGRTQGPKVQFYWRLRYTLVTLTRGKAQYRIKCFGCKKSAWEPEEACEGCRGLIQDFKRAWQENRPPRLERHALRVLLRAQSGSETQMLNLRSKQFWASEWAALDIESILSMEGLAQISGFLATRI